MMQDLTQTFLAALSHRDDWHPNMLTAALREQLTNLQLDWDDQAGEAWMRLLDDTGPVCLIWMVAPVAFALEPRCPESAIRILQHFGAIVSIARDFDASDYQLDLGDIRAACPTWRWSDVIPASGFSINDLWWATV